jgi:hypothetical protein
MRLDASTGGERGTVVPLPGRATTPYDAHADPDPWPDPEVWVHAGPLGSWAPIRPRTSRRQTPLVTPVWIMVTEIARPGHSDAARSWLRLQATTTSSFLDRHQAGLGGGPAARWPAERPAFFWRISIGRVAIALGAHPAPNRRLALAEAGRVVRNAEALETAFLYRHDDPRPTWLAHLGQRPALVSLGQHELVAAGPEHSLASLIADARVQAYVHLSDE